MPWCCIEIDGNRLSVIKRESVTNSSDLERHSSRRQHRTQMFLQVGFFPHIPSFPCLELGRVVVSGVSSISRAHLSRGVFKWPTS